MKVLLTDFGYADTKLERQMLAEAGMACAEAQCRTPEEVIRAGHDTDAFVASYAPITREVFAALPRLRFVTALGVGVDHIDVEAARENRVWVANVPDANVNEVATHALGMALALVRHLTFFDRAVRQGRWNYEGTGTLRRPSTLTLGIVGLGRIGRQLARLAEASFGHILGHDPHIPASGWPGGVERSELGPLFRRSDVVSLHLPLTEENGNLVGHELLGAMRPGSYLVNVSRGGLVDIDALLPLLDSGHLAGAALDVLPQEPPPPDHPILKHPRVLLNPHAAFYSLESEEEARRKAILNILKWAKEGRPPYVVVEGRSGP
ncbi:MAG: C-terminal binding protein [Kiloniellales bacterium]